jgi:hypothetical protein
VEKNQYELCLAILRRLHDAGILDSMIMIGSWCIPFYEGYFKEVKYRKTIRTRDVDFLIPSPHSFKKDVNLPELLKDLGFVVGYKGSKGYIKLEHPELMVEFLVPERGKGTDKPVQIPRLGINAVALRFLHFLSGNTIKVKVHDFYLTLPHPANFALHKLIIFQRRLKDEKASKDREAAVDILRALIDKGEAFEVKKIMKALPMKWQKKIEDGLKIAANKKVTEILLT